MVPEQVSIIILDIKSAICMAKNGKDTKHTRHIPIGMHFVINGKELNLNKTVWYEVGLQMAYIGTNNVMVYQFNHILLYAMVRLDNL